MFSRYRILRFLGQPPPDMVSLGKDDKTGATVVLHMLPEALCSSRPGDLQLLEDCLETLAEDELKGIPQVCCWNLDKEVMGFVEVYHPGERLDELLSRSAKLGRRLPLAAVAALLDELALILEDIHSAGLFHGDVRPGKLLVHKQNLSLLGLPWCRYRPFPEDLSSSESLAYLPPEALGPDGRPIAGKKPDRAWDIYQAGLVAYELYAGQSPFPALEGLDAAVARKTKRIPPISGSRHYFPRELQDIVFTMLSTQPERRFKSARAFRKALVSFARKAKKGGLDLLSPAVAAVSAAAPPSPSDAASKREAVREGTPRTDGTLRPPAAAGGATPADSGTARPASPSCSTKEERGLLSLPAPPRLPSVPLPVLELTAALFTFVLSTILFLAPREALHHETPKLVCTSSTGIEALRR